MDALTLRGMNVSVAGQLMCLMGVQLMHITIDIQAPSNQCINWRLMLLAKLSHNTKTTYGHAAIAPFL
jgi:hypothetical protein